MNVSDLHIGTRRCPTVIGGAGGGGIGATIGLAAGGPIGAAIGGGAGLAIGFVAGHALETKMRKKKFKLGERQFDQGRYIESFNYFHQAVKFPLRPRKNKLRERAASQAIECLQNISNECQCEENFIAVIDMYRKAIDRGYSLQDRLTDELYQKAAQRMIVVFKDNIPTNDLNLDQLSKTDKTKIDTLAIQYIKEKGTKYENEKNFIHAIDLYRKAINRGYPLQDRLTDGLYMQAARRKIFEKNIPNTDLELGNLSQKDKDKVKRYQKIITEIRDGLSKQTSVSLATVITPIAGHDTEKTIKRFSKLLNNPLIKPIMEMGKFGTLGIHHLSNFHEFTASPTSKIIDPTFWESRKKLTIKALPKDAIIRLDNREAVGVYDPNTVEISTAMRRGNPKDARGTLVHELTHYVAHEVFANGCLPYKRVEDKDSFKKIAKEIRGIHKRGGPLHEIIKIVFTAKNYNPKESDKRKRLHDIELIVRIPQLIARGVSEEDLSNEVPELLKYYKEVFLKKVNEHVAQMTDKAEKVILGDWSRELLTNTEFNY